MKFLYSQQVAAIVIAVAGAFPMVASAQAPGMPQTPGFSSKPIQSAPLSGDDSKELYAIAVSIEPGGYSPPHIHPGDCMGYVIEGKVDLLAEGTETRRVATGEAFSNARGTVHQFKNTGDKPTRLVTFLVVEKGKPRVMPPPAAKNH